MGLFGNWAGGTVHSFADPVQGLRFAQRAAADARTNAPSPSPSTAGTSARRPVSSPKRDPALARELRIGRPDLPREYDDGGLVDINHAPAEVIATSGMTLELAQKIVEVRETVGGFISAEELSATVGLPPQLTADLAEYTIYLD